MRPLTTPCPATRIAEMARRAKAASVAGFHFPFVMMSISCEAGHYAWCTGRHTAGCDSGRGEPFTRRIGLDEVRFFGDGTPAARSRQELRRARRASHSPRTNNPRTHRTGDESAAQTSSEIVFGPRSSGMLQSHLRCAAAAVALVFTL